jgi:hypothetical protein
MNITKRPNGPAEAGVVKTSIRNNKQRLITVIIAIIRCSISWILYTKRKRFEIWSPSGTLYVQVAANAAKNIFWRVNR